MSTDAIDRYKTVFTATEVATLCGVSVGTVYKLMDEGTLKGYRLPPRMQHRRFPREHLVTFCRQHGIHVPGVYEPEAQSEEQ